MRLEDLIMNAEAQCPEMPTPTSDRRRVWIRRIFDIFLYSTAAIGLLISYTGVISPQNTYIQCNDPSISHNFGSDTISLGVLLGVSLLGPLLTMLLFEWTNPYRPQPESPLREAVRRTYNFFLSLLVGELFALFVVEVLKTAVSEARPHFMTSCHPNLTGEVCQMTWIHVTEVNCSNPLHLSRHQLIDSMKSFPSGHAALGIFTAVFMMVYVQRRVRVSWSNLLKSWLQLVWWTWAVLCCASRVWDSKHHWFDVGVGGVIGAGGGYATVAYLCCWFEDPDKLRDIERLYEDAHSPSPSNERKGHLGNQLEMEDTTSNGHLGNQLEMEETISNHHRLLQ